MLVRLFLVGIMALSDPRPGFHVRWFYLFFLPSWIGNLDSVDMLSLREERWNLFT